MRSAPAWVLAAGVFTAGAVQPAAALDAGAGTARSAEYRLGERLPPPTGGAPVIAPTGYKLINWDALMPANWDPMKVFKGLDLNKLSDADPRAMAALERLRTEWNNAPAKASMNGARIRIPGFVVPLENARDQIREFLLVPYFGACIHSPPPPSNQVIHVFPATPLTNVRAMDAVWVNGQLETARSDTGMGSAGYRMKADSVTPYRKPRS
jgi:hypothetical protein